MEWKSVLIDTVDHVCFNWGTLKHMGFTLNTEEVPDGAEVALQDEKAAKVLDLLLWLLGRRSLLLIAQHWCRPGLDAELPAEDPDLLQQAIERQRGAWHW